MKISIRKMLENRPEKRFVLHTAAREGMEKEVLWLVTHGCNVDEKDMFGYTALHHACRENQPAVVKVLLDLNVDVNLRSSSGETALHLACKGNHLVLTEMLLAHGATTKFDYDCGYPWLVRKKTQP